MALWQILGSSEQDQALHIDSALSAEFQQRWARHEQHPEEAVSWDVVRQNLDLA